MRGKEHGIGHGGGEALALGRSIPPQGVWMRGGGGHSPRRVSPARGWNAHRRRGALSAGWRRGGAVMSALLALFLAIEPLHAGRLDIEKYPRKLGSQESIGKNIVSNGIPVSIEHFRTHDPVGRVLDFYEQQWRIKGHHFIHRDQMGEIFVITAIVDLERNLVKSVMAYREPEEDVTYVFPSSSTLNLAGFGKNPKNVPIFPKSQVMTSTESNEGGRRRVMVVHRNGASIPENLAFYRTRFRMRGWRPLSGLEKPKEMTEGEFLFLMKRGATCFVSITRQEGGTYVVINLME